VDQAVCPARGTPTSRPPSRVGIAHGEPEHWCLTVIAHMGPGGSPRPVVHPIWCGLDVHPASVVACLRCVGDEGQRRLERREYGTTHSALLTLGEWLLAEHCPMVAMESTGASWRPVSHLLCGLVEVVVGHPQEIRPRPGTKTDTADASWMTERLAHGLIRPSCIPPPTMQAWRDLTQTRVSLVQTRTQATQRVLQIFEDTTVKVATVVSDLFGVRGRRMLAALMAGERHPQRLAALALGTLRRKVPQLA